MSENQVSNVDRNAIKAGTWYIVSEILIRGISFITTPIFTRILSTAVYGEVKTFDAWVYLFTCVLSLGLYNSIERAKFDFKKKYDSYISSVIFLMLLVGIFTIVVCYPFQNFLSIFLDCSNEVLWLIPAYAVFNLAILCVQKREKQLMNYKSSVLISFLVVLMSVVPASIFVLLSRNSVTDEQMTTIRIKSFYIPLVFLGLIFSLISFFRGKTFVNFEYWTFALKFSLPFIIYSISVQILNQSDKIMIKKFCGSNLAGIYAVATTVVYIMDILNNAVHSAFMPWMFEKLNENNKKQVVSIWKLVVLGMGFLSMIMVLCGPELILFLGGEKYYNAIWLLGPMLTGSFIHFITIGYTNIEKFYKKTKCVAIISILSISVNLMLNYIFINRFGYSAAAYTTAFSYFIEAIVHYIFLRKYKKSDVIPAIYTFMIIFVIILMNLSSMFLYNLPFYVRWVFLLILLFITGFKCKSFLKQGYSVLKGVKKTNE